MVEFEDTNPKVLLVDDKPENIAVLIDMLEPLKLELFVALHGKDALSLVERESFDLILLDIAMPDMDGYEVCKELKTSSEHRDIPVIFISALSSNEDKIKGFSYGADDYIVKPFLQDELLARVKLHLQKRMLFNSLKSLLRKSYHELYNPLAIINTSLEMQSLKHGTTEYTDAITVASRNLQIVYDDLYYSLSSSLEKREVSSIELFEYVKKRVHYFLYLIKSKNITIDFQKSTECFIQMREDDLLRLVDNTISNAIKYADIGSVVEFNVLSTQKEILFSSKNRGSEIKNTEKVFQKSYREDFEQIGMGIGLEIVSSICARYHIKAEVTSQDKTTFFRYFIPI